MRNPMQGKMRGGRFRPKALNLFRNADRQQLTQDVMAGIIVGIVALPLAIAFAIASGVSPEIGIFTAIIGGFIVSALGGSSVQIGGPTGAFIIIVYGIIQKFGLDGLIVATLLAGGLLVLMGVLKLGTLIRFVPYPHRRRVYRRHSPHDFLYPNERSFWLRAHGYPRKLHS